MKKMMTLGVAAATCLFSFQSCKKKAKEPVCKMQQLSNSSISATFQYDDAFRLSNITSGNNVKLFVYSGNTTTINTTIGGTFANKTILTLNDQNQVINSRNELNTSGTDWENIVYTYNGKEVVQLTMTSSSSSSPSIQNYGWTNGNLTSVDGTPVPIEYATDKLFQDADYYNLLVLLSQGYTTIINKNLMNNFYGTPIFYTFDDKGKITSLSDGSNPPITITYTCR